MKYLLDTNTCIRHINGRSESIKQRILALKPDEAVLCAVVVGELIYGARRSQTPEKTLKKQRQFIDLFQSLPFNDASAEHYATLRADLAAKGTPISGNDMMIAAIALANGLILVTHNVREFSRVNGLKLQDWQGADEN